MRKFRCPCCKTGRIFSAHIQGQAHVDVNGNVLNDGSFIPGAMQVDTERLIACQCGYEAPAEDFMTYDCGICGSGGLLEESLEYYNGLLLCEDCASKMGLRCSECGKVYPREMIVSQADGENLCRGCDWHSNPTKALESSKMFPVAQCPRLPGCNTRKN